MKSIILYYSYSGNTKTLAEARAAETGADIEELRDLKRAGILGTFFSGCLGAMQRKPGKLHPIKANLADYDEITIMVPVYAGHPVRAFNNAVQALPQGKRVHIMLTSSGGNTSETTEGTKALITAHGCEVASYEDIKTGERK